MKYLRFFSSPARHTRGPSGTAKFHKARGPWMRPAVPGTSPLRITHRRRCARRQSGIQRTTNKGVLSTAATAAASSAVLALAIPAAEAADDSVYALIETHKATTAALNAVPRERGRLEDAGLPSDESAEDAAFDAEEGALTELVETVPTTLGGAIASMDYIVQAAELDSF